mmetsp:Transcript_5472/g.8531  ORF Transcript_5472/g.8531 Transcript_5472/m.8531 type:complete len:90 (+) Transcript_5472:698-967(+)
MRATGNSSNFYGESFGKGTLASQIQKAPVPSNPPEIMKLPEAQPQLTETNGSQNIMNPFSTGALAAPSDPAQSTMETTEELIARVQSRF